MRDRPKLTTVEAVVALRQLYEAYRQRLADFNDARFLRRTPPRSTSNEEIALSKARWQLEWALGVHMTPEFRQQGELLGWGSPLLDELRRLGMMG